MTKVGDFAMDPRARAHRTIPHDGAERVMIWHDRDRFEARPPSMLERRGDAFVARAGDGPSLADGAVKRAALRPGPAQPPVAA